MEQLEEPSVSFLVPVSLRNFIPLIYKRKKSPFTWDCKSQNYILTLSLILNSLRGEERRIKYPPKKTFNRPTQQMWALAHWLVEAGTSCGALAAKRRRSLLFVPGDTTPITLSVGADYLWKPFSLTRAGDVSVSRAHSSHHRTSLPHTATRSESSQSKARVRRDITGGVRAASRGVLRQVYFRQYFLHQLCLFRNVSSATMIRVVFL